MLIFHLGGVQASLFSLLTIIAIILAFVMLGSHWIKNHILAFAAESWVIAALSAAIGITGHYPELVFIAALTALFRGTLLPYLLVRIVNGLGQNREFTPLLQPASSIVLGGFLVLFSYALAHKLGVRMNLADSIAVLGAMSLAAMPPTAGFVNEWYLFQSLFHDFTLKTDGSRIALALAGAGMTLTAAIALATMVKLFGVGLLGQNEEHAAHHRKHQTALTPLQRGAVLITGLAVPAFAVSLVFWLPQMAASAWPAAQAPQQMAHNWLLVPLSAGFAFISPAMLVIVVPLLALIPLALVWVRRRYAVRRAPLWCGGEDYAAHAGATTALSFSNALRVFYNFIYRPQNAVARQFEGKAYFLKELQFDYSQAPLFGPLLFSPAVHAVQWLARKLRFLQNGLMNAYLAYIGVLLLVIFGLVLVWTPG